MSLSISILALFTAAYMYLSVLRQDRGTTKMKEIGDIIKGGAEAFMLNSARKVIPVMIVAAAFLSYLLSLKVGIAFVIGACCSGLASFIGMGSAVESNTRTTNGARKSLRDALYVAFTGGSVMGLAVAGLALFGLSFVMLFFEQDFLVQNTRLITNHLGFPMIENAMIITGYALGCSLIALFNRVGGGIYTKAADVGADLVGKVESRIPEDDPRNPGTIADNVGDNVGDVAGLGADLLESFVGSIVAGMVLIIHLFAFNRLVFPGQMLLDLISLPMLLGSIGIVGSIIGVLFIRKTSHTDPQRCLMNGMILAAGITLVFSWFAVESLGLQNYGLEALGAAGLSSGMAPFWCVCAGILAGVLIGETSEYFTSSKFNPTKEVSKASQQGSAVNILEGLALGMKSTSLPVIILALATLVANQFGGLYGVAIAALGMLSFVGITVAIDTYGPIADNAGGIAEMAGLPKEVRKKTDHLDAVGNTTAAVGKGFAIGAAAFAALGLFSSYMFAQSHSEEEGLRLMLNIIDAKVIAGVVLGGMLTFVFSGLLIQSVGRTAYKMIDEIRRQFKAKPGILKGKSTPDYNRCIKIAADGALKEMVKPGLIAVTMPIIVGFTLGPEALGGLLLGVLVCGVQLAIQTANSGGSLDNAKKYIEEGRFGGKGSDTHAAAVVGDTVGDPLKDTVGPSLDIMLKIMSTVSILIAPLITNPSLVLYNYLF